jgi:hypothetical protein
MTITGVSLTQTTMVALGRDYFQCELGYATNRNPAHGRSHRGDLHDYIGRDHDERKGLQSNSVTF